MPTARVSFTVSGPLAELADEYAEGLTRLGYTRASVRMQLKVFAALSKWLLDREIAAADLKSSDLIRFLDDRRSAGYSGYSSLRAVDPILDYLQRIGMVATQIEGEAADPVERMLGGFWRYLTVERALAAVTARSYLDSVRLFVRSRVVADDLALGLKRLCAADVINFVTAHCPSLKPGAAKAMVTALRSFLGFLHLEGVIAEPLSFAVPSVAGRKMAGLPRGLSSDQAQRLLASCDKKSRRGCRDIAILTMLVRLGMRAGEVAKLQLGDIDWRAGEIVVRGKGNCIERLPLPSDVGEAVAEYLQNGRPPSAQGRTVFVRIKAPHRHLTSTGVSDVVVGASERAGLGRIRAHRLRHTAAMQMLRAGASLPEVGQLLRHRSALTTAIYAKVDRETLRLIARPWPGALA